MKRTLHAVWYGAVFAVSVMLTSAFALTITGRNSENARSIFQTGIPAISREDGIVASTTQTLAGAYQLTAGMSIVATANVNDAVKLPSSLQGPGGNGPYAIQVAIVNNAANSINVFPFASTDVIVTSSGVGSAGAALALPTTTKAMECWAIADGRYYCQLG
jgi:hypothetical protein